LQLTQNPRNLTNFNPYYLGWDRSGSTGSGGVGIHHPMGDVKKIATLFGNTSSYNNYFWRHYWNQTANGYSVTEGGSSGSPFINSNNKHVIGQLWGGSEINCNNPSQDYAIYGKFSVSWTGNGAADNRRRLNHWLDPAGTNPSTLNGISLYRISGPSIVCSSGGSFTVNNLPTGATITWSQGPNLTRTSAQGANPCTFSSTGSGSSWIRATVVIGSNTITLPDKVVWSGIPQVSAYGNHIVDIQTGMPISDFCYGRANEAKAVHLAGEAHISDWDWRVSYGQVFPYGVDDQYATIYPNDYYSFMLEIRAGNACGYSGWARMYTNVVNCRSHHLVFTPNPTIGETILSIESDSKEEAFDENAEWEMEIYSQSLLLMKKKTRQYGQSTRIQTADWKEGVYIVRVLYKGEVLTGKLMVSK
jgi:hypothetical protein